jgi:hypothetical protein
LSKIIRLALALACVVLQLGLAAAATKKKPVSATPPDPAMTFTVVRSSFQGCEPTCPEWIAAEGRIKPSTGSEFRKFMAKLGKQQLPIIVTSPGGDVESALSMGKLIRSRKLDVAVGLTNYVGCSPTSKTCKLPKEQHGVYRGTTTPNNAYCLSACPFILAGGQQRLAGFGTYVGVHQITTQPSFERVRYYETYRIINGRKKILSREVISRKRIVGKVTTKLGKSYDHKLGAYLAAMGTSPKMLDFLQLAKPEDMHYLTKEELKSVNLVTDFKYPSVIVDNALCRQAPPAANCILDEGFAAAALEAAKPQEPLSSIPGPPGLGMNLLVIRSSGTACEPLCTEWIYADGKITKDTPSQVEAFLKQPEAKGLPFVIRSDGGDVDAAMALGRILRKHAINTEVGAVRFTGCETARYFCRSKPDSKGRYHGTVDTEGDYCNSACVLALAGGKDRIANYGKNILLRRTDLDQFLGNGKLERYLRQMGIGGKIVALLKTTPPNSALNMSFDQLREAKLVQIRAYGTGLTNPSVCNESQPPENCIARN